MKPNDIVTYTIVVPHEPVAWWCQLLCCIVGHSWSEWKKVNNLEEERYCKRCKLLGIRAPAWTVLP